MRITHLFAGIPVRNLEAALVWYAALLGRQPDRWPHAEEAVWQMTDGGLIYVVVDPDRAGYGLVTLIVDDLDGWTAELAAGIEVGEVESMSNGVRRTRLVDPDGNTVSLAQVSASA